MKTHSSHDPVIGQDDYVNATALCGSYGVKYRWWARGKKAQGSLVRISERTGIAVSDLVRVTHGFNGDAGTFVHPLVAEVVATWCLKRSTDPEVANLGEVANPVKACINHEVADIVPEIADSAEARVTPLKRSTDPEVANLESTLGGVAANPTADTLTPLKRSPHHEVADLREEKKEKEKPKYVDAPYVPYVLPAITPPPNAPIPNYPENDPWQFDDNNPYLIEREDPHYGVGF
jgi:hypothetical protein